MSNSIGDLRNSGNQGNNFPWQLKMLEGLQKIYDEVKKPLTCAEDSVALCSPGGGLPVIIDCNDRISLCVNGAIVNSTNALPVTITNPLPLEVNINQANDSILIYGFDGTNNQPISVGTNGFVNTNATVTFPASLPVTQDPSSNPWTVDGTVITDAANSSVAICGNDGITTNVPIAVTSAGEVLTQSNTFDGTGNPITSTTAGADTGLDVNIIAGTVTATIDCTTSSIAICDGTTNLAINNPGGPADGSINTVLIDFTSGSTAVINPDGTQNNAIYGYDYSTLQNEAITSTDISPTVQALDVNVAGFSRTPNILISSGDPATTIAVPVYSISFFNNGSTLVNISMDGGTTNASIPAGVTITMDAGGIQNTYPANTFIVGSTIAVGASMIVTYNS
jgi:hypothetical protein